MPLVIFDQVRSHLHGRIDDHPLGDLLGKGRIHAHIDLRTAVPEFAARRVARIFIENVERAGREVHRPGKSAGEGDDAGMFGRITSVG